MKDIVDGILEEKKRPLTWLAGRMDRTFDGLRVGLIKESIKYRDILKMARVLDVSPCRLFEIEVDQLDLQENMVAEKSAEYGKLKNCEELIVSLKNQIIDKERIIKLLSKGNIDDEQNG